VHQPRNQRGCVGELIQIDGSEHYWFDDRGPPCALLVYIDDATGRLMHLKFVETESTFDYFRFTREYLEAYGKPVAFCANKHAVFRVNGKGAVEGDGMTQLGGRCISSTSTSSAQCSDRPLDRIIDAGELGALIVEHEFVPSWIPK
jgi:hypothetical protein